MTTIEEIFDERYPLDKRKNPNHSFMDKYSMKNRKGFITGAAGGLGRNTAPHESPTKSCANTTTADPSSSPHHYQDTTPTT